jgi:hypothetical protein
MMSGLSVRLMYTLKKDLKRESLKRIITFIFEL